MKRRGDGALVVVERTAGREIVLMIRVGDVRHRQAPIVTSKIECGGRLAAGGPDQLARSKLNVHFGVAVLIKTSVADRVRLVALIEVDRAKAPREARHMTERAGDLLTGEEVQKVVGVDDLPVRGLYLPSHLEGGDVARRKEAHGLDRAGGVQTVDHEV